MKIEIATIQVTSDDGEMDATVDFIHQKIYVDARDEFDGVDDAIKYLDVLVEATKILQCGVKDG